MNIKNRLIKLEMIHKSVGVQMNLAQFYDLPSDERAAIMQPLYDGSFFDNNLTK
jgi:hypothetical protein